MMKAFHDVPIGELSDWVVKVQSPVEMTSFSIWTSNSATRGWQSALLLVMH